MPRRKSRKNRPKNKKHKHNLDKLHYPLDLKHVIHTILKYICTHPNLDHIADNYLSKSYGDQDLINLVNQWRRTNIDVKLQDYFLWASIKLRGYRIGEFYAAYTINTLIQQGAQLKYIVYDIPSRIFDLIRNMLDKEQQSDNEDIFAKLTEMCMADCSDNLQFYKLPDVREPFTIYLQLIGRLYNNNWISFSFLSKEVIESLIT
eukprot:175220_1